MSAPCPVLGFVIRVTVNPATAESIVDALIDDLMALLETNGLVGAGEGDRTLQFVVHRDGSQATEHDRQIIAAWSPRWTDRATIDVGPILDLNPTV